MSAGPIADVNFDHYDGEYAANPFPVLETLRRSCPVAHSDAHGGFWLVTRYEDVQAICRDTATFSSQATSVPRDIGFGEVRFPPVNLDPPEHTRAKRLLSTAFASHKIEVFMDPVRARVVALLEGLLERETFDLSHDFARLVPTLVVCELLGCPGELDRFIGWVERLLEQAASNIEDAKVAGLEMFTFMSELMRERRERPGGDVVSMLLDAEIDGERLDDGEVIFAAVLLVLAGIDTTQATLASALLYLATHPDQQQRLRDEPQLVPTAREEFLRAFAPVTPARVVTRDVEYGSAQMTAQDMLLVSYPSANRDEAAFEDAAEVRLDREPNRHLAFGYGVHRCLGVHVARLELTIALEEVARMVPPFVLADDDVAWARGQVRGPKHVRVRLAA